MRATRMGVFISAPNNLILEAYSQQDLSISFKMQPSLLAVFVVATIAVISSATVIIDEACGSPSDLDSNVIGPSRKSNGPFAPVVGTTEPAKYMSHRYGKDFTYTYRISNGPYNVTLGFAETTSRLCSSGMRVFDVYIQGQLALAALDVFTSTGACNTALKKTVENVIVTDGRVNIRFTSKVQNAMVSSIEIVPAGSFPAPPAPIIMTTGPKGELVSTLSGDAKLFNMPHLPVANTENDLVFARHRAGFNFAFSFNVTSGTYRVQLGFAETFTPLCHIGSRIFIVTVGSTTISNFDAFAAAGACYAATFQTVNDVVVTNGVLNVSFTAIKQKAFISSIAIMPLVEPTRHIVDMVDAGSDGDTATAHNISGTSRAYRLPYRPILSSMSAAESTMLLSHRAGRDFSYTFNVPAGNYNVRLGFAETFYCAAGKRVFDVYVAGSEEGLESLDVFETAGGCNKALWKTISNVKVYEEGLTIRFASSVENAMVSSLQVLALTA
jgi:hypothetical protein